MSGYLQRLVLRAMRPLESIHPQVGSVYSPVKYGDYGREESYVALPSEPDTKPSLENIPYPLGSDLSVSRTERQVGAEETTSFRPYSGALPELDTKSSFENILPTKSSLEKIPYPLGSDMSVSRIERQFGAEETTSFQHSTPTTRQHFSRADHANEEAADREEVPSSWIFADRQPAPGSQPVHAPLIPDSSSRSVGPKHSSSTMFASQRETPTQERQLTMQPVYPPIVPADLAAALLAHADKTTDRTIEFPSAVAQGRKNGFSRPAAPLERDTNEIQIHIGRIEVTALPPAQLRPAPPSPRKGLSLQEYLKRSDRRAR